MIRPLRQQHHRIVIALSLFLPVTFAVGIAARRTVPINPPPPGFASQIPGSGSLVWEQRGLFHQSPVTVRFWKSSSPGTPATVELSAPVDFVKPDLLVYWISDATGLSQALPDSATLLGPFSAHRFPANQLSPSTRGRLVLYSVADGEIVDVSSPVSIEPPKT